MLNLHPNNTRITTVVLPLKNELDQDGKMIPIKKIEGLHLVFEFSPKGKFEYFSDGKVLWDPEFKWTAFINPEVHTNTWVKILNLTNPKSNTLEIDKILWGGYNDIHGMRSIIPGDKIAWWKQLPIRPTSFAVSTSNQIQLNKYSEDLNINFNQYNFILNNAVFDTSGVNRKLRRVRVLESEYPGDIYIGGTYQNEKNGPYSYDAGTTTYDNTFEAHILGLVGISKIESNSKQSFVNTTFESVPFKYSTIKEKIPEFNWEIKQAKHFFNYWSQIGYYGYDGVAGENLPTHYVALSDIDNPEYTPSTKLLDVFTKTNDIITKTIPWKNNLVVFTENSSSLFTGRVPEKSELLNSELGVSNKYRDTVQVISDSIVFKNGESVFAFVPTPGTDGATSIRVRDISTQIKSYISDLDKKFPNAKISSITFNNEEYWLIYTTKDKTIILRYNWRYFAWTVDEYNLELTEFFKINSTTIEASDSTGVVYELLSDNSEEALKEFGSGSTSSFKGIWQDISLTFNPLPDTQFEVKPITYEFMLGARRPSLDTNVTLDDVTVITGNDGTTPTLGQKLTIYSDGFKLKEFDIDINASTTAISEISPQNKWSFGVSQYETPLTKHTKKVRKSITTIDLGFSGSTYNKLFLDSILFRYRASGRKNYSR